jgi:ElaB/YqjD/DUF883 family membrane-anchored ribosome-binding protein
MDTEAPSLSAENIQALAEALKPMIREEVERAVSSAGANGAGEAGSTLSNLADTAAARLEALLGRAEEKARGFAEALGVDAADLGEDALGKGREVVDQAGLQVKENPIAALFIALGFGFILGVIFGPGRR